MQKITPFLWFNQDALKAAKFYTSIFRRSRITQVTRYGKSGPGPVGSVMTVRFEMEGQEFTALNGGPAYKFTHAVSFVVSCRDQREIDTAWRRLSRGGKVIQCGWLTDRFGMSWQVVPDELGKLLDARHPERSERVMAAVMGMRKLNLARLRRAYAGK
jgi:predicted 3-demethylubiquinone-9 3-methyltransferase (glyoxalase superfamily)